MKNVLYIGNALSQKGKNITSIEVLGARLRQFCNVKIASKKQNQVLRLLDMMLMVIKNRRHTDYVLIDTYSTLNFYYAFFVAQLSRCFNIKYITILHGGNLEKRLIKSPKKSKLLFGNAHRLVSPSVFLRNTFANYGYDNVEYIPNSISIEDYEFSRKEIEKLSLLWVRSFSKIYNPKLAVLLLDSLVKKGYDAELCMVGPDSDGTLKDVQKLAKDLNLDVKFTGKLPKEEWLKLSKEYNIFINTTNYDNMPISVVEAMALGLPVVSTNVGGLPFLISHNEEGLLVSANDVNAFVEAIEELKENKKLKDQLITNARKKVEKLDWEDVKIKWQRLLS